MANIQKLDIKADIKEITEVLEKDGCVVLMNAVDRQTMQMLDDELEELLAATVPCKGNFFGFMTKRISGMMAKSDAAQSLAYLPKILDVLDKFLLQSCSEYQLNLTQVIQIGPGEPQQAIHTDDLMFHYEHPGKEAMINCMWAVDEFTRENGATLLVPGSHRWARDRIAAEDEIAYGAMPKGSVLIYFGSLQHAGGANKTDRPRTGMVISYCLGWLRQAENQYLAVPSEIAKTLPQRLQRLLGYFVHSPNLGCVNGRDPIEALNGKNADDVFKEYIPPEIDELLAEHRLKMLQAA